MQDYSVSGLLPFVSSHPAFEKLSAAVRGVDPGDTIGPLGLRSAARSVVVAALAEQLRAPLIWITPQPDEARILAEMLRVYLPRPERVHLLPAPDPMPYERIPWDPATREHRLSSLAALHRWAAEPDAGAPPVIVAAVRGLMVRTLPPDLFASESRLCRTGDRLALTSLARQLVRLGYESVVTVTEPGQFARRGGIVDVFPPADHIPTRLEWFGDNIDSMRHFDPSSQRSQHTIEELLIVPAAEALPERGPEVAEAVSRLKLGRMHPIAESEIRGQLERLRNSERFSGLEFFGPLLHMEGATALDYLPDGCWQLSDDVAVRRCGATGRCRTGNPGAG
jgi:transcription-repair coupling factor (superfamily II helicase)